MYMKVSIGSKVKTKWENNKIAAINAWAVTAFIYGAGKLQWKESELNDGDKISRKAMIMYGALHLKSNMDRLYIERKEGGRGLMREERCVKEENSLGYVANSKENLIKGDAAADTFNTEDTVTGGEFKKQKAPELKQNWCEKKMHGHFVWEKPEKVDKDTIWQWLSKSDLKQCKQFKVTTM